MTINVTQNTPQKFTVYFNNPVNSLTVNDVKVVRNLETSAGVYPYPQTLKSVSLAKDKMSATVEIFQTMMHETNYTISVKDHEDYVLTASNGKPVRMELKAKDMNPSIVVYTNNATLIEYTLYDAKGVQVALADGERVRLTLDRTNSSKEVSFSGDKLTIRKNTASATVTATYQGYKENGKNVGSFSTSETFFAEDAPEVVPVRVEKYTLDTSNGKWWSNFDQSFQLQEHPVLYVGVVDSNGKNGDNKQYSATNLASSVFAGNPNNNKNKIVFEAMTPEIAVINDSGVLTGLKPGVATFYVKYVYVDANKKEQSYPFDEITIEVLNNSYVDYVTINESSKTIGTAEGYNTADLFILGRDQYGNRTNLDGVGNVTFKTLTEFEDNVKTALANVIKSNTSLQGQYWDDGSGLDAAKITVKAAALRDVLAEAKEVTGDNDGECISIEFEATYAGSAGKKTVEFTVTIQEPSGETPDNVIDIVTNGSYKDVMRKYSDWDNGVRGEKTAEFYINWMNNDVQVGTQSVTKFDADAAEENDYQVKVLKDGVDITGDEEYVIVNGSKITVKPSYIKDFETRVANAVSGGAVAYDKLGEGVYTLELYKWTLDTDGTTLVESLEGSADISVGVGNAGAYSTDIANLRSSEVAIKNAATGDQYDKDDAELILQCFLIKNTEGKDVVNPYTSAIENLNGGTYFVNYTAVEGTNTVYVKEIVFYEPIKYNAWDANGQEYWIDTEAYVAYTVEIDKALTWKK